MLSETIRASRKQGRSRQINVKNTGQGVSKFTPIDRLNSDVIGREWQRVAPLRPIAADRDYPTVVVTHDLTRAPLTTGARTPDLLGNPPDPSQQRFGDGPLVLKSPLPLQPLRC